MCYFLSATVIIAGNASGRGRTIVSVREILGPIHSFFYTTIVTFPFLVTGIYWAALTDGSKWESPWSTWNNVTFHILNTLFATFEIVVSRTNPTPWFHLLGLYAVLGLYFALTCFHFQLEGWWPYAFLEKVRGGEEDSWICPVLISISTAVGFVLVRFCIWLRKTCTEREKHSAASELVVV